MKDRLVEFPNRFRIEEIEGQTGLYNVVPEPGNVTEEGTFLNKKNLLSDVTGNRYGLDAEGTVNDMFERLMQEIITIVPASGWSSTAGADGWFTNRVVVDGMKAVYNPIATLVITSAALADDEQAAFGIVKEIETFDGYVICRALDPADIDFKVRFTGV